MVPGKMLVDWEPLKMEELIIVVEMTTVGRCITSFNMKAIPLNHLQHTDKHKQQFCKHKIIYFYDSN